MTKDRRRLVASQSFSFLRAAAVAASIDDISWTCGTLATRYSGSDLWSFTWSSDGNQYTAWGDGGGTGGGGIWSWGIARIAGGPPTSFTPTDLAKGPSGTGQGKIGSIFALGSTLYVHFNTQSGSPPGQELRKSTDNGATLGGQIFAWDNPDILKFINHGQGNEYGDGYVYASQGGWNTTDPVYLMRVAEGSIETESAWLWWDGSGWDVRTNRSAIFTVVGGPFAALQTTITYLPPTGEYLLLHPTEADVGKFRMYLGPNPWGPWTLLANYTAGQLWPCDNFAASEMLPRHVPPKWIGSISGGEFDWWMIFSAADTANGWDSWNEVQGTFTVS